MEKRKLGFFVGTAMLLVIGDFSAQSQARVDVSVGINIPAYTFPAPPPMVVIPGTYAYFAPNAEIDIVFYHGYWYRPYESRWYRARAYNGPWTYLAPARVPSVLIQVPPDYRHRYRDQRHIEYRDFHKNWRRWERSRYWERDERWREGRPEEHRERGRHY
ncbi:MAG TPA: hypothetical protein VFG09_01165 [Thermodesulfovibrionales bacterium]|jgi:hypothetical protein|nr:hypothetical protein [Thermodesulfovibrionales bacterium]